MVWLINLFPQGSVITSFQKTANAQYAIIVRDAKTDKKLAEGWGNSEEAAVESVVRCICDDLMVGSST